MVAQIESLAQFHELISGDKVSRPGLTGRGRVRGLTLLSRKVIVIDFWVRNQD